MEPETALVDVNIKKLPLEPDNCLDNLDRLFNLIDTQVKIEMIKNYSYCGYLHAIDPVTKSVILTIPADDTYSTTLIPGHAITTITTVSLPTSEKPQRKHSTVISEEDLKIRKQNILNWLKKHLLPAEEDSGVIDIGNVSILSPYTVKDICASNPVVAERMKRILESLPE